mgnify:FL=1|jgi:argininosuccinate lyase
MKLWSGRFSKSTDPLVDDFNSSIRFDSRLYKHDILGSVAHTKMLGKCGIIPEEESSLICKTLLEILADIENGNIEFEADAEDIHMNIEKILISRIGETGKKLHTGRSRNDQVSVDTRMYLKDENIQIRNMITEFISVLIRIAEQNLDVIMPGYTHLQRAQPVTFAHHLMAYVQMLLRDRERLSDCYARMNVMPLGSCALAGTTYNLDRRMTAIELGFDAITENSIDAVSDRDFVLEMAFCLSVLMMHMSRFSEEIILWCSHEFSFIELDDAFSTGSSIMPQKKNPDIAELVRGKSGRVYGNLMALLTVMKALPLAYNKDMQEDKEAIFDSIDTVKMCLPVFTKMIETMKINRDNMLNAAKSGFTNATDIADYLVKRGVPFRDSHNITGKIVAYCIEHKKDISELTMEEFNSFSPVFEEDIYSEITLKACVNGRKLTGGPAEESVKASIAKVKKLL